VLWQVPPDAVARLQRSNSPIVGTVGMVVEDSMYGITLSSLLRRWTKTVVQVRANAVLARQVVDAGGIGWVIIDNGLSGLESGVDLARWLRANHPSVLRVAHSGHTAAWMETLLDTDAEAYPGASPLFHAVVPKPIDATVLVAALAALRGAEA